MTELVGDGLQSGRRSERPMPGGSGEITRNLCADAVAADGHTSSRELELPWQLSTGAPSRSPMSR